MKKSVFVSLLFAALPFAVSAQNVDDDLYYIPKKEKQKATTTTTVKEPVREVRVTSNGLVEKVSSKPQVVVRDNAGNLRDVDEYNRCYSSKKNNFSYENDTLYIDEREDSDLQGEWVNGFDGSKDDYEYAVRLIRFQNPRYAIPVSSPLYWDIVYAQNYVPWDWNIYDDGMYAYVFPTFSNRYWFDWRYNSFGSWRWGWGWDPWYSSYWDRCWGYGWNHGVHWGWSGYYDPYYWHAHGPYYGWGYGGHYGYSSHRPIGRPDSHPVVVQRGHDRSNRYNSGVRYSGTRVGGVNNRYSSSRVSGDDRYTNTRVDGSRQSNSTRYNGVQGYRSQSNTNRSSSSVRPVGNTRSESTGASTSTRVRSTSSYVRPSSSRVNSSTYSRPSSTRSSNSNYNSEKYDTGRSYNSGNSSRSSSSRSYDSGSSVRSSGFSSGHSSAGSSSRSGGGRSRR